MIRLSIIVLALLPSVALAQPAPPPPYVPFTVEQSDYMALRQYLDEQPMKFSLPIAQWAERMQAAAKAKADKQPATDQTAPGPHAPDAPK